MWTPAFRPNELADLLDKQTRLPEDFHIHPKVKRLLRLHREMAEGKRPLDWATAEVTRAGVTWQSKATACA